MVEIKENKNNVVITCVQCGTDISDNYENHKCSSIKKIIYGTQKMDLSVWLSMYVIIVLHEFDLLWFLIVYILLLEFLIDPLIRRMFK